MADIPGLIEGAHEGQGLGDRFLGHVERTNVLLHLIDCTQDDVVGAYKTIRHELKEYGCGLEDKDEIVALNKADALGDDLAADVAKELEEYIGNPVHIISAVAGRNINQILYDLGAKISNMKLDRDSDDDRKFLPEQET